MGEGNSLEEESSRGKRFDTAQAQKLSLGRIHIVTNILKKVPMIMQIKALLGYQSPSAHLVIHIPYLSFMLIYYTLSILKDIILKGVQRSLQHSVQVHVPCVKS